MPFRAIDPNTPKQQGGFRPLTQGGVPQQPDPFNLAGLDTESLVGIATQRVLPILTPGIQGDPNIKRLSAERKAANDLLISKGFTPAGIKSASRAQELLDRPRFGQIAGGIAGGLAGAATFGPDPSDIITVPAVAGTVAKVLGATVGAGAGGVAGEAAQTAIEEKRLIDRREALTAFATEAGSELGGRGLAGVGKLAFSPLIKKTFPEAAALVDDFAKFGGGFSPTELDDRASLRIGEAFSRGSFGADRIFQVAEEKQGKAALAFAGSIIDDIGEGVARQTPEEIGEIFAEGITRPGGRVLNILDDLFTPLYSQVDELGAGATVSTKGLKTFAKKHLATDTRLNGQFLSPAGKSKLTAIVEGVDELSFSDMRTLRSTFLKDVRKMARDVDQSQGIIKQLAGLTDEAIFDPAATKGLNQEAINLLKNTNRLYRTSQKGLETTLSEKLAKRLLKNPSSVAKEVFPNNNPKAIRLLRESLVEPISGRPSAEGKILWNQLRQTWIADAVEQATKTGVVKPNVYDNIIRKMGPKAFNEMFPEPAQRESVKKIQTLFSTAGKTAPKGASLFARGAQTAGAVTLFQGTKEGDAVKVGVGGALLLGPLAFAKLATTPNGVKLLTAGFKARPGTSAVAPTAARMVRLLQQIDKKESSERRKQIRSAKSKAFQRTTPSKGSLSGFGGRGF